MVKKVLEILDPSWLEYLQEEFSKEYMASLSKFLNKEKQNGKLIYPPSKEIFKASQRWGEPRVKDLRYFNVLDTGGHFAAFEQPELYVQELRACFQKMS